MRSFIIYTLISDEIKQDVTGIACRTYMIVETAYIILFEKPGRKRPLARPGVDGILYQYVS
jgi:hypothetical protein